MILNLDYDFQEAKLAALAETPLQKNPGGATTGADLTNPTRMNCHKTSLNTGDFKRDQRPSEKPMGGVGVPSEREEDGGKSETQACLALEDPAWVDVQLVLWWAISCRDFTKRQKRLLMFILKESFGRRRGKAYVASLESFDDYTRLHVSHVSETLKFLKAARVIAEYPAGCYGFRFPISDWVVKVLPERMYHEEQLALIQAPPDLEDTLREVFIDDIKNLPTRGPITGAVHLDRSRSDSGPSSPTGGVVSRESVGSVPDDQAAATGRGHVPQGRAPTSPEDQTEHKREPHGQPGQEHFPNREKVPESGNEGPAGPFPESGKISEKASKMATARKFPESGNAGSTALMQYCSNAPKEQYCTVTSGEEKVPELGSVQPHGPPAGVQQCKSASEAGSQKGKFNDGQQALFDELAALRGNGPERLGVFGPEDEWFPFWVVSVRDRYEVTIELLGEVKYAMLTRAIDDPGAWMMDKWRRWGKPKRR